MKDRMERFVLLPFTAGCISESSVAVALQQAKRSKTEKEEEEEEEEDEELEEDEEEESLSFKTPSSLLRFHKLLKNFKNLSHSFAYKEELEEETEIGMEIGVPTDVKHVTHIGMDGCATSILSKGWNNNLTDSDINKLTPFQLPHAADNPTVRSLLETK